MNEEEKEAIEYFEEKIKNKLPLYEETYVDGKLYRRNILQLETNFTEEQSNKAKTILNLIAKQQKEIEELKQDYQILKDDMKGHRVAYIDTPEFEEKFISKDKIREKIEFYKSYGKIKNSNEYVMSEGIEILQELLGEENEK